MALQIWDLESKAVVAELVPEFTERAHLSKDALVPYCISLAWSADGATLYGGYTDNIIRVWKVMA
jgi:guanine nucleotide-binding protein subunit beta-2-like 1 protein